MDIILWRHAEAVYTSPDISRELSAKGQKHANKVAAFLKQHLPPDATILVSPATRTRQTVESYTKEYTVVPSIAPDASAHAVLQAARWPNAEGTVLIVGHQPTLGAVAALLLGSAEPSLSIKKGALWWFTRKERDNFAHTALRLVFAPDLL